MGASVSLYITSRKFLHSVNVVEVLYILFYTREYLLRFQSFFLFFIFLFYLLDHVCNCGNIIPFSFTQRVYITICVFFPYMLKTSIFFSSRISPHLQSGEVVFYFLNANKKLTQVRTIDHILFIRKE